jgi:hypothetical protein
MNDVQTLENKLNALIDAVESSSAESFKFSEFADAISQKYNELFEDLGEIPTPESSITQTIAQKFEIVRQRVELNASVAGTDESIFKPFLDKAQDAVSDLYSYVTGVVSGIFGSEEPESPEAPESIQLPQPPSPPSPPGSPSMSMAEVPTPPPMAGGPGPSGDVPPPLKGRNDRVGPGGSNFSKSNIIPSDTQQYLKTFEPARRALDKEMKDRGYQKVGPGGLRREGDGSIRRKSQYGGAVGSLSNLLGDIGNTLTKNRRVKQ